MYSLSTYTRFYGRVVGAKASICATTSTITSTYFNKYQLLLVGLAQVQGDLSCIVDTGPLLNQE